METEKIIKAISTVFNAADEHDWFTMRSLIADELLLDYGSLCTNPALLINADDLVQSWKNYLPGFDSTHHHLYDFKVKENGLRAVVVFKGRAEHNIDNEQWIVEGNYNADLEKIRGCWMLTMLQLALNTQAGNRMLLLQAAERCKEINIETLRSVQS